MRLGCNYVSVFYPRFEVRVSLHSWHASPVEGAEVGSEPPETYESTVTSFFDLSDLWPLNSPRPMRGMHWSDYVLVLGHGLTCQFLRFAHVVSEKAGQWRWPNSSTEPIPR